MSATNHREQVCAVLFTALFVASAMNHAAWAGTNVIHVPADYEAIQEAIDAATDGDQILVAPCTYSESINLLGKAITLRSAEGPEKTTIDGQSAGTVITCDSDEGQDTVIEGFGVRNGSIGMHNEGSRPTVINGDFRMVTIGILNEGGSPSIIDSSFYDIGCWDCDGYGGIRNVNADASISGCTFVNNWSDGGAGVFSIDSKVVITGSSFSENVGHTGAGPLQHSGGTLEIAESTFTSNSGGPGRCRGYRDVVWRNASDDDHDHEQHV